MQKKEAPRVERESQTSGKGTCLNKKKRSLGDLIDVVSFLSSVLIRVLLLYKGTDISRSAESLTSAFVLVDALAVA